MGGKITESLEVGGPWFYLSREVRREFAGLYASKVISDIERIGRGVGYLVLAWLLYLRGYSCDFGSCKCLCCVLCLAVHPARVEMVAEGFVSSSLIKNRAVYVYYVVCCKVVV